MRSYKLLIFAASLTTLAALEGAWILRTVWAKRQAESMMCGNYMCSICIGARSWAFDNNGQMPSDFLSMSNELATPRILICPGDRERQPAPQWAALTPEQSSYEIVTMRLHEGDSNGVFLRCRFHTNHIGYADGTVFDGSRRRTKAP
jgi:hypothetical protein